MTDGTVLGNFATNLPTPQQVSVLGDGSVLGTATIAAAGIEGIYHWESDGSLRRFIDTEILKGQFGEFVPHGAYLLGDGNYLVSGSTGVYKYSVLGNTFSQILGGVDAQYINYVALPGPGVLPLLALGFIAGRRRRS
jgi:hypothetical protein